jgi:hypothetical protein
MSLRCTCLATAALILCSCAGTPSPSLAPRDTRSQVERLFPLLDGYIYTYQNSGQSAGVDMFMIRVRRTSSTTAQLVTGSNVRMLTISADHVRRDGGGFVLRAPLQKGASWQGDKGIVRVVDTGVQVKVPAGSYLGCVQVVEEVGGDARGTITTFFCPEVGIARMRVQQWQGAEELTQTTELRSFGPPMDLRK